MFSTAKMFLLALVSVVTVACSCNNTGTAQSPVAAVASTEIEFKLQTTDPEDLKIFTDGFIPWISIKDASEELPKLIGRDEVVLTEKEAVLIIDYPLNNPTEIIIKAKDSKGFTRGELAGIVSTEYHRIYAEEEESAKTKTMPMEQRPIMNRNETDGKYGIWGHDIDDLDLSSIIVHREGGKVKLELMVES